MKYIIIDVMEGKYYSYSDEIEMGFSLDMILDERDKLEIPYVLHKYNNGKVISIRDVKSFK